MDNQLKELFGAWVQAIGTVIAAIGGTPSETLSEDFLESLNLVGNELQAVGNALIADAQETFSLDKLGNEIQAIGNTTVIAGILLNYEEEIKQRLDINGNWLQALGGAVGLPDDLLAEPSTIRSLNISGNILQIVGNSMQAIGGTYELRRNKEPEKNFQGYREYNESKEQSYGERLATNGGWIQAVGSVLEAISQTKENVETAKKT